MSYAVATMILKHKKLFALVSTVMLAANTWAGGLGLNPSANFLAVGLPAYAAAVSYFKGDELGLTQLVQSEAVTVGVVEALKLSVHKTRPDGSDNQSFPSMHAAVAFSAAQYLQMKGGWEYGVPAYALASYVSFARVEGKKHYWNDVFVGGAIGALASYSLTDSSTGNRLAMSWVPRAASVVWQQPLK